MWDYKYIQIAFVLADAKIITNLKKIPFQSINWLFFILQPYVYFCKFNTDMRKMTKCKKLDIRKEPTSFLIMTSFL